MVTTERRCRICGEGPPLRSGHFCRPCKLAAKILAELHGERVGRKPGSQKRKRMEMMA